MTAIEPLWMVLVGIGMIMAVLAPTALGSAVALGAVLANCRRSTVGVAVVTWLIDTMLVAGGLPVAALVLLLAAVVSTGPSGVSVWAYLRACAVTVLGASWLLALMGSILVSGLRGSVLARRWVLATCVSGPLVSLAFVFTLEVSRGWLVATVGLPMAVCEVGLGALFFLMGLPLSGARGWLNATSPRMGSAARRVRNPLSLRALLRPRSRSRAACQAGRAGRPEFSGLERTAVPGGGRGHRAGASGRREATQARGLDARGAP